MPSDDKHWGPLTLMRIIHALRNNLFWEEITISWEAILCSIQVYSKFSANGSLLAVLRRKYAVIKSGSAVCKAKILTPVLTPIPKNVFSNGGGGSQVVLKGPQASPGSSQLTRLKVQWEGPTTWYCQILQSQGSPGPPPVILRDFQGCMHVGPCDVWAQIKCI